MKAEEGTVLYGRNFFFFFGLPNCRASEARNPQGSCERQGGRSSLPPPFSVFLKVSGAFFFTWCASAKHWTVPFRHTLGQDAGPALSHDPLPFVMRGAGGEVEKTEGQPLVLGGFSPVRTRPFSGVLSALFYTFILRLHRKQAGLL